MTRRLFLSIATALALSACVGARGPQSDQPPTSLRVENQSFLDMTIYLLPGSGSQRIRLGIANGNSTTTMRIPSQYVFGATSLRFLADPIGGNRTPISESITVSPGDEVGLIIPPTM
jgi:hypothetical protein